MRSSRPMILTVAAMAVACGDLSSPAVPSSVSSVSDSDTAEQSATPSAPTVTRTTSWGYNSLPVSGKAEASTDTSANNVIVTGGAATTAAAVSTDGSFCADVSLNAGKNTLVFITQREDGTESEGTSFTVNYDSSLAEDDDDSETQTGSVTDVALHNDVGSNVSPTDPNAMTDGSDDTASTFDSYPSVYIDLGETYQVESIEIQWAAAATSEGQYADDYDVFTSVQASPTRPVDTSTTGWSTVGQVAGSSGGNGDGDLDTFTFGTPISARWVGLTVNSNNTSFWSWDWSVEIASIRVKAPQILSDSGANVGTPTCSTTD